MSTIDISEVFKSFKNHFEIDGNSKIVFSAKYGIGKSYFLNSFFKEEYINERYSQFVISPVNYVVSSNEDVFDLIKVDIIKQLYLHGKIDFNEVAQKTSSFKIIKRYIKQNPMQIVKNVSSCLSKVSGVAEAINGISESVIDLIEDFGKFEKKIEAEETPSGKKLLKYAETFTETKNSYLEHNFISQLIFEQLAILKTKAGSDLKNVLVIEDFDRLDPAHIFRILNIFSAHQTEDGIGNKFGFDKIILVCDLDNIENIYKHFYGEKTDFKGYIDKFYSLEPYYFDNKKAITTHLKKVLNINLSDYALNTLVEILNIFINNNTLSLRNILQTKLIPKENNEDFVLFEFSNQDIVTFRQGGVRFISSSKILINKNDIELLLIFRVLKCLFGNYSKLAEAFSRLHNNGNYISHEIASEIAKTFALPHLLEKEHSKIIFNDFDRFDFNYPIINVLNHSIRVMYASSNSTAPYTATKSFFDQVNLQPINPSQKNSIKTSSVIDALTHFLNNYLAKGYLYM